MKSFYQHIKNGVKKVDTLKKKDLSNTVINIMMLKKANGIY